MLQFDGQNVVKLIVRTNQKSRVITDCCSYQLLKIYDSSWHLDERNTGILEKTKDSNQYYSNKY